MSDIAYVSEVRVERLGGSLRAAYLPGEVEPTLYGMHGAIAAHYGAQPGEEPTHASTIDHLVGAALGQLTGTFAGALAARRIDPTGLVGHARGEVELDGKVLVLRRVHVTYTGLTVTEPDAEKVDRVLAVHAHGCPVARSLEGAIEITTQLG